MTKLSHLHFTTNQQATNRVLGMGEEAWRVRTVGFPAIDLIAEGRYAGLQEVSERLGLNPDRPVVLFTQHSVTTEFDQAAAQVEPSIAAMRGLANEGMQIILTYPNNDAGGKQIIEKLEELTTETIPNIQLHRSLGRHLYHGVLALARDPHCKVVCVGNSSSGIKETPAFGCPAVNVGSRQDGRLRGANVIDADYDSDSIVAAVHRCMNDGSFRDDCRTADNPYFLGGAGINIANVLATIPLDQSLIRKRMTLVGETADGWFR